MLAETIKNSLKENSELLKKEFGNSLDLMEREMVLGELGVAASLFYIEGIVRMEAIEKAIIMPCTSIMEKKEEIDGTVVDFLRVNVISTLNVISIADMSSLVTGLLNGKTVIFVSGESLCLLVDTVKWPERDAPEPKAQRTPIGPDIGFNESITNNLALIRKTIKDPCLRVEENPNADVKTTIKLVYLEGKVDKEVLDDVKSKLQQMNIQIILDVNYLEEALITETRSTFPLMLSSDRPDVVSAEILSGKIGILVDGTPFIATVPSVFVQFFQSPDDYYSINRSSQNRRLLRLLFFLLSLLLPGVYIAFTLYHPGLIPTSLLVGLLAQREIVPFPTIVEIVIFFWLLVIITEGSLRLPSGVVLTVTIFSSIILGQQAVEAKLVQPTTLVVLGASYVMSSVVPLYSITTLYRKLTFRFIILGSILGLYGIMIGLIVLILHLSSLRSFGVPYLSPMAPFQLKDQKDALFRVPIQYIVNNKKELTKEDKMKKQ